MLDVELKQNGKEAMVRSVGRIDVRSASVFKEKVAEISDEVTDVLLDVEKLDYISSAGLAVILFLQKRLSKKNGVIKVRGACTCVREAFDITGFSDFLVYEEK